jgi:hypothetical protein
VTQTTHYVYWLRGADFSELAAMSIESVQRVDSNAKIHVVTDDPHTPFPHGTNVRHMLQAGRPAMVANLDAQIHVLNYLMRGDRVLFLDADTLLLRPFAWALYPKLFVTWRKEVNGDREMAILQPYNYGVVGAHVCPEVIEAFYWMRARVLQMSKKNQDWYGNQLAIAELVGAAPAEGTADKDVRISWAIGDRGTPLVVRQLPCDVFNYSPNEAGEDISAKAVLHLKGNRKDLMKHYAEVA